MGCCESRSDSVQEVGPFGFVFGATSHQPPPRTESASVRALVQVLCLFEPPSPRERPLTYFSHVGPSARWQVVREGLWGIILCKLWENLFRRISRTADTRSQVAIADGLPTSHFGHIRYRLNSEHSWWRFTLHCVSQQYGGYLNSIREQGFELRRIPLVTALRLTSYHLSRS